MLESAVVFLGPCVPCRSLLRLSQLCWRGPPSEKLTHDDPAHERPSFRLGTKMIIYKEWCLS